MKKLMVLTALLLVSAWGVTLSELKERIDAKTVDVGHTVSELLMTIERRSGQKVDRKLRISYFDDPKQPKVLLEFLTPTDVKGTKLLTHINSDKDNDQWLYLPSLKRVKRIVGRNKSGSFMGSSFSYEDFGKQDSSVFEYEEAVSETTLDGVPVYKGVRYPKDKGSGYSKQVIYALVSDYLLQRVEYYDKKGSLLKVASFSDYKEHNGIFRVGKIVMENVQTGLKTTIVWEKDTIHAKLKARDFEKRALKR